MNDLESIRLLRLASLNRLAEPLRGLRVLLYGFSGAGFPGGDGVAEAVEVLPRVGVDAVYTHQLDPDLGAKIAADYDVAIVTNTRIGALLDAPARLWEAGRRRALWFWDLRPGSLASPLRGRVDHVFLSFDGPWTSPAGMLHAPEQWAAELGCPVSYAPQASPLREPQPGQAGASRIVFVGDLANATYHAGRAELCRALNATVLNASKRNARLAIEAQMPTIYASARYCLSTSPRAPGYTSVRTYSILACGGLLLLHRFPGCERLFEDGTHAVIFDDAADARERIAQLDADYPARARIAAAGRALQAQRHTVAHRILSILGEVTGTTSGFSGWL